MLHSPRSASVKALKFEVLMILCEIYTQFLLQFFSTPKVTDYKTKNEYFHKIYKSNLVVPNFYTRDILVKSFYDFLPKA